jgi:hypothetical protein
MGQRGHHPPHPEFVNLAPSSARATSVRPSSRAPIPVRARGRSARDLGTRAEIAATRRPAHLARQLLIVRDQPSQRRRQHTHGHR